VKPTALKLWIKLGRGLVLPHVWGRVFVATLVIIILGSLGVLGYVIATPKEGEAFTEFYLLGEQGEAANYPKELKMGDEGWMIIGIVNHERREVSYRVEVIIGSKKSYEVGPVALVDEQKWEGKVGFVPEVAGEHQKVEFLLYKDGEAKPYLGLHLWVDVSE